MTLSRGVHTMLSPYTKHGIASFDAAVKEVERVEKEYKKFGKRITPENISLFNQQNPFAFDIGPSIANQTETFLKLHDNVYVEVTGSEEKQQMRNYIQKVLVSKEAVTWEGPKKDNNTTITIAQHSRSVSGAATRVAQAAIDAQNGDMQVVRMVLPTGHDVSYAVYSHHHGQSTFVLMKHNLDLTPPTGASNERGRKQYNLHEGMLSLQAETPAGTNPSLRFMPMGNLVVTDDVMFHKNCEVPLDGCSDNAYTLTNRLLNMFVERDTQDKYVRSLVVAVANLSTPEGVEYAFKKGRYHLKNEMLKNSLTHNISAQIVHPGMFNGGYYANQLKEKPNEDPRRTRVHIESAVGKVPSITRSAVVKEVKMGKEMGQEEIEKLAATIKATANSTAETRFHLDGTAKSPTPLPVPADMKTLLTCFEHAKKWTHSDATGHILPRQLVDNMVSIKKYACEHANSTYVIYHSINTLITAPTQKNGVKMTMFDDNVPYSHKFFVYLDKKGFSLDGQGGVEDGCPYVLVELDFAVEKDKALVFVCHDFAVNSGQAPASGQAKWYHNDNNFDPIKMRPSQLYETVAWYQHHASGRVGNPQRAVIAFEEHTVNMRALVARGSYEGATADTYMAIFKGQQTSRRLLIRQKQAAARKQASESEKKESKIGDGTGSIFRENFREKSRGTGSAAR